MENRKQIMQKCQQGAFIFGIIATSLFVIFSIIAMTFYPGGYAFFSDPLSQLGFTQIEGNSNFLSSTLFNSSMFLVGIAVALIFLSMLPFFSKTLIEKWFSITGSIFAVFSGIALCGAALTPGDINFEAHVKFAPFTFLFGILMVVCFAISMIVNKNYPRRYTFITILYVLIMISFLTFLIIGPSYDTPEGAAFQITTQKIAIYSEMITLFLLSYGGFKYSQSRLPNIPRKENFL
ncbi:MAG: DUF998 domain-containing protein [Candidatus Heimdallarchaeota archaeon]|nr:DUF998 domain-containing protein [Candidatus Heimdallarchaeota archaeon]